MRLPFHSVLPIPLALLAFAAVCLGGTPSVAAALQQSSSQAKPDADATASNKASSPVPRGKKLVLKDGSYQLVREYQKNGDRVRYFSTERGAWEEIPGSMVDWNATKKAEAAEETSNEALLAKVHIQEAAAHEETPVDVDASLLVGPGVFLPAGEGMFVVQDKSVRRIEQAGTQVKTDKKTVVTQVLTPIPIIPSKHNVEIPGTRATTRLITGQPEFFLREVTPDAEHDSAIQRTSRMGDTAPEVVLVRAKVKGNKRLLESIRTYFGQEITQERQEISIQRWDVAPEVFRFTLGEALPPGEYALVELLPDGLNLFVWDFGVDAPTAKAEKQ